MDAETAQLTVESPIRRFNSESIPNGRPYRFYLSKAAQQQVVKLVQRVFVIPESVGPRVVVFSSVDQGHGSGEICCQAVDVLATQVSGSICLVDANLRAPWLHQVYGIHKHPGLADAASSSGTIRDFAVRIPGVNLWVVPAGSEGAEFPGLFSSPRFHLRMEELRQTFDYVLIDAPAVGQEVDALLLGQRADGLILVLEANSTRREEARKAKATLQELNVKLLGAILNNRTFPVPEAIYRKL
jgi:Mrp family chromosome partitioning ATPase